MGKLVRRKGPQVPPGCGMPGAPLAKGLPKTVASLCPECCQIIPARIFEREGEVWMEKRCPEHGEFHDIVWSDVRLYMKAEEWAFDSGSGVSNPAVPDAVSCPHDCGLCQMHLSHTGLANIDLTNRCNLTCPVCFANANAAGYVYEPSLEDIRRMLRQLREMRPVAARVIQFSGGEPTISPYFIEAVRMARDLGFSHIQVATNGLRFATDPDFAERCAEAGLHTLYLQFDGVSDEVYRKTRGQALWELKQRAVEAARRAGLKIVFVPTVARGVNDHEVGRILRFALENIDVASGITYQPVTFTGRISQKKRRHMRYTLTDLVRNLAEQTGIVDTYHDWYPTPCTVSFSQFLSALQGEETIALTCHPHCSLATYLFVDARTKTAIPVTRFVDVEGMLRAFREWAPRIRRLPSRRLRALTAYAVLRRFFHPETAPPGLTYSKFLRTLEGLVDKRIGRGENEERLTYRTLLVSGMHFMDAYNYQLDRVMRCVIHYAAPDGRIYPFCAYNSGITFREKIERRFSIPLDVYPAESRAPVIGQV